MNNILINRGFLKSAQTTEGAFFSCNEAIDWIKEQNKAVTVSVKKISFNQLKQWYFDDKQGILKHDTGGFFSIEGIRVNTNRGSIQSWDQPIMNQDEVGYLGFIVKEFQGILHFLLQAKVEPGNTNHVQLSPTLQATKSNYTQVHKGKAPDYLNYFTDATADQIMVDQLQSEQGARFLKKRNRNIIIKIEKEIAAKDNFIWLTLGQIKELMQHNNLINMDTRTVLSGIPYIDIASQNIDFLPSDFQAPFLKSIFCTQEGKHRFEDILAFLTRQKVATEVEIEKIPLRELQDWEIGEKAISHKVKKHFNIIATEVNISSREVVSWSQPMVEPVERGICAFIAKEIDGILHFAVQAKFECGNFDKIELAPTVQCLPGNYIDKQGKSNLPFLEDVLKAKPEQIIFDTYQSEEGGRFYYEQNRNMLILADRNFPNELPENYIWMTLNQLHLLVKFNNYINIQARCLLSAITFLN